ncbi:TetR/AcrR family transcriptional regulator [Natrialbaceae archaeon A-CW2]|uniref:TetR/AcrR family transcriptional regulator n=1 Tax=Natronosalvus amylolyticus TaxID=2961994 RepID=UPI0020C95A0A|nr:TetR/AcrR family transcriptional regulator [Natronosalvus amylolyticus]
MTDETAREAIMTATYEALCEHGYTELTAQAIADRTDKSKSLLFYHYDSKEDLVAAFFDFLLEHFAERVEESRDLAPVERLATYVDWFLYDPDDEERTSFHTAMLELRAQAPYNDRFQEQLRRSDDALRSTLEEILEAGIDSGAFVEHDSTETAALLIAALDGARIRQLTMDRDVYLEEVRAGIIATIVDGLLAEGVEFPARAEIHQESSSDSESPDDADSEPDGDSNTSTTSSEAENDAAADTVTDGNDTDTVTDGNDTDTTAGERADGSMAGDDSE